MFSLVSLVYYATGRFYKQPGFTSGHVPDSIRPLISNMYAKMQNTRLPLSLKNLKFHCVKLGMDRQGNNKWRICTSITPRFLHSCKNKLPSKLCSSQCSRGSGTFYMKRLNVVKVRVWWWALNHRRKQKSYCGLSLETFSPLPKHCCCYCSSLLSTFSRSEDFHSKLGAGNLLWEEIMPARGKQRETYDPIATYSFSITLLPNRTHTFPIHPSSSNSKWTPASDYPWNVGR